MFYNFEVYWYLMGKKNRIYWYPTTPLLAGPEYWWRGNGLNSWNLTALHNLRIKSSVTENMTFRPRHVKYFYFCQWLHVVTETSCFNIPTFLSWNVFLSLYFVTQFVTCCTDWDNVTVKFVVRSDDILIYALQKWEQFSLVYSLSLKKKNGFRPVGLRFRPAGLRFRPVGLRFRPAGLRFRPAGLRWVFVFDTSNRQPSNEQTNISRRMSRISLIKN